MKENDVITYYTIECMLLEDDDMRYFNHRYNTIEEAQIKISEIIKLDCDTKEISVIYIKKHQQKAVLTYQDIPVDDPYIYSRSLRHKEEIIVED
jgi:hypothetical protein